jgi:hypothetical protein
MALATELQDIRGLRSRTMTPYQSVHVGDLGIDRIRRDVPIAMAVAPVVEHHTGFDGQMALLAAGRPDPVVGLEPDDIAEIEVAIFGTVPHTAKARPCCPWK